MLECTNVAKWFGGVKAVVDCSLKVEQHSIVGLIGPNGAGKTTLFNVIAGTYRPTAGEIYYKGKRITGLPSWKVARERISRTFQTPHGFPLMTVMENMLVAPLGQKGEGWLHGFLRGRQVRSQETAFHDKAMALLEAVGLLEYRNELVVNLSAGDARLVEMMRQLMMDPELLLLDEPAAGINPALTGRLLSLLKDLREQGKTLLVIDHNLGFIMNLCDYVYVMARGEIISQGTPGEVANDPKVIEAYVGRSA